MSNFSAKTIALAALAVGWTGAAEAKACHLDGLELVSEVRAAKAVKRRDLVGVRFRVVRQASAFKTMPDQISGTSRSMTGGNIAVELASDKGRFVVDQGYIPHSAPWVSATSWAVGEPGGTVAWGKRNRKQEVRLFEGEGSFDVYGGPLAGMTLAPVNCTPTRG